LHRYFYAGADPLNRIDPSGQFLATIASVGIRASLQGFAFGGISAGFALLRGQDPRAAFVSGFLAGFGLGIPYLRVVLGFAFAINFIHDLATGRWDAYTFPELLVYVLAAVIINRGVMPRINQRLGIEPLAAPTSAPVPNPGYIVIASNLLGNVRAFLQQFRPGDNGGTMGT
jgi:hypothetical protein